MNFDLTAPLPTGTTVLEASAGTGKTYAIVGLATRFVAEGVCTIADLLLVTFSRTATQELRERTRTRFTAVVAALSDPATARSSPDDLCRYLADADAVTVALRRSRLLRALSDFDAGTIATTHSFCQRMLDGLGIAGDREPDAVLVETVDDLITEVIDDIYLRTYSRSDSSAILEPKDAAAAARAAIRDRQAVLMPDEDESEAGQRVGFARKARKEVDRRKRVLGYRDFDDLLVLLHNVIEDPVHGDAACRRIRERFSVVLIDEFQDTDPLQWDILRKAFHGSSTLVLVGDPKQAIYAFRGAEVLAYLDAVRRADQHTSLSTNWRSDARLLGALGHLYEGASLGHEAIVVRPVQSVHRQARLTARAALRVRYLPRRGMGPINKSGTPAVARVRPVVAEDVAADIVELLSGDTTLTVDDAATSDGPSRPVTPGDIAVLVRTWKQVALVRAELDKAGVPSVLASGSDVFQTAGATQWLWVLQALEQPHRSDRVRLAALTPIFGWTAELLDSRGDDAVAEVGTSMRSLAALFAEAGFAAVFERLAWQTQLESRLLAVESGERHLTDLRHIAQLLNRAAVDESLGLTALTRWLTERVENTTGVQADRSRRLDSDAAAVQIATIHASKGLEFPIVYVPYAWDTFGIGTPSTLTLHDENGSRVLDVGGATGNGFAARKIVHDQEQAGEELRLLYVALTRAKCQVVMWWAPTFYTPLSPAHRLLFGRVPGVPEPLEKAKMPDDDATGRVLDAWAEAGPAGVISVEPARVKSAAQVTWGIAQEPARELAAAQFDRTVDSQWRRTSYSALTAGAHHSPGVGSEPENAALTDEPELDGLGIDGLGIDEPSVVTASSSHPSPMNGLPAGAAFGTLVHEVLEFVDTSAPDLEQELVERCRAAVTARLAEVDPDALAGALLAVMRTPLGFGTLADIPPGDRLAELDFELPLAGGDNPMTTRITLDGIAALLLTHLPADDVLAPYAARLDTIGPAPLRGYLTGSIDSVLRVHESGQQKYVIVDYKTNRISRGDLTVDDFSRERMAEEMMRSHYPLQALLYTVALHRYLRWRLPTYDPAVNLGGVQYQFVRGMVGPETPSGCGVFEWTPPTSLVTDVSDFLSGGVS